MATKADTKAAAKKPVVCGAPRKDKFGAIFSCKQTKRSMYAGAPAQCPERDQHVMPLKTGNCHAGFCEGKKVTVKGRNMKTCDKWATCPCQCHSSLDQMFTLSQQERTLVDSSGYVPDKSPYVMPTLAERAIASVPTVAGTPVRVESPAPGLVPAAIVRTFAPTATGRAARGELESWVWKVVSDWLVDKPGNICNPPFIAREIAKEQGIKEPSTGAITACLDRWALIGFAVVERKPLRFVRFTDQGVELGLEAMKLKYKQSKGK